MMDTIFDYLNDYSSFDLTLLFIIAIIAFIFSSTVLLSISVLILRIENNLKTKRWKRMEEKWEPLLLDVLSDDKETHQLISKVERDEQLYFVQFLQRFTYRLRGKERAVLEELVKPFLPLIVQRVKIGNPERRAQTIQTLSAFRLHKYTEHIVEALDDPSPTVAMLAARSLSRKEFAEYANVVLSKLYRFESWSINYLASMLESFGPVAAPVIRKAFSNCENPLRVRTACAEALYRLRDLLSADIAVEILANETDTDLLAAALRLLGETGCPKHLEAIRSMSDSDDFVIRAHSLKALAQLGTSDDIQRHYCPVKIVLIEAQVPLPF